MNQEIQINAMMCDAETQMSRIMEKKPEDGLFSNQQSFDLKNQNQNDDIIKKQNEALDQEMEKLFKVEQEQ